MKTSPRSFSPFVMLAAAIVCWVFALSLALRIFFDASITGGWLIVGGLFSFVAFGLSVLVKEFNEAILIPVCSRAFVRDSRGFPVPVVDESGFASWEEQQRHAKARRSELGLSLAARSANRPRVHPIRTGVEETVLRVSFEKVFAASPLAA